MKLWVMSDLHLEFEADGGKRFFADLPDIDHDVAILAGDICSHDAIARTLWLASERFKRVLYVIGNHECYGATIDATRQMARQAAELTSNVTFLEQSSVEIGGVKFHGATLWFPYCGFTRAEAGMNDFFRIQDIRETVDKRNRASVHYLEDYVEPGDVVVTHHLPHTAAIDPKYASSPLNQFFLGGAAHVLVGKSPAAWVFGHTHSSVDLRVNGSRLVCNPRGYYPSDPNPSFNPGLTLEL